MKKIISISAVILSSATLAIGGTCMTCKTCSGHYYACESEMVDYIFDEMDNCAPGSTVEITELDC